jgi:hypothetical protein
MCAMSDTVKVGQKWLAPSATMPVRVMAVSEGWAMVRHKGCTPFILYTNMMTKLYEQVK